MQKSELLEAFKRLGQLCESPTEIIVAGGAAMILAGYVDRDTGDGDAIESNPKLSQIQPNVAKVGEEMGLKEDWLNDGVRAHRDLLPEDFHTRVIKVARFGNLTVLRVGRKDLVLMKLAAFRPRDIDDVHALKPTVNELSFIESQLERINNFNPMAALRIKLYLQQVGHQERPTAQEQ